MGPFEKQVESRHKAKLVNTPEFPRLYVEYIAETEGCSLEEAARRSLSRIFRLFTEEDRNAAIITAFRGEYSLAENRVRNRKLMSDLRTLGYGFTPVIGGWIEHAAGGDDRKVEEESLVVSAPLTERVAVKVADPVKAADAEEFQSHMLAMVRKYDQDGVLLKLVGDDTAHILNKDGSSFSLGPWRLNNAAQYYTILKKGGQRGRRMEFAFECAGNETLSTRQAVQAFFEGKVQESTDPVVEYRYWMSLAREEQSKGQSAKVLGNIPKARQHAEKMKSYLGKAKAIEAKYGPISE